MKTMKKKWRKPRSAAQVRDLLNKVISVASERQAMAQDLKQNTDFILWTRLIIDADVLFHRVKDIESELRLAK